MLKRIFLALLLISVGLSGACAGTPTPPPEEEITVAFTTIFMGDPFFVALNDALQKRADELGVNLILHDPDGDPIEQVAAIENFIAQDVDVIVHDALDPVGILPALRAATEAGIPNISVDEILYGTEEVTTSVGDDSITVGREVGERLLAWMDANDIEKGVVGVIQTISPLENLRVQGFQEIVDENPDRLEIVGLIDAQFSVDASAAGAENMITANPDLNFIMGTGALYLIGALSAVKSQGVEDRVKLIGWSLSEQLVEAMEEDIFLFSALADVDGYGRETIDVAVKLARGEEVDRYNWVPVFWVTKENAAEMLAQVFPAE
jgi:ribose transport system substrate-binding protein